MRFSMRVHRASAIATCLLTGARYGSTHFYVQRSSLNRLVIFNHPNFNIPNRTTFTQNFGRISGAQDARQFQLALKMTF